MSRWIRGVVYPAGIVESGQGVDGGLRTRAGDGGDGRCNASRLCSVELECEQVVTRVLNLPPS